MSTHDGPTGQVGWLPASAEQLFGPDATAEETYDLLTVDVPAASWLAALATARDTLGCGYFDWLSAVDEPGTGFWVVAHLVALARTTPAGSTGAEPLAGDGPAVRALLLRTTVPHDAPTLPTATGVYAGAAWHERETHEMFGIDFTGHPGLAPLLLPEGFEGHPLRKDFVLAARVAKAWPGAKEPGEPEHGGPKRRQMLPPGVPDPNEWGPLKGQLAPAPGRPPRGARTAGTTAGERPVRRMRSASAGSASQRAAGTTSGPEEGGATPATPRRNRGASGGSASQRAGGERPARRGVSPDTDAPGREPSAAPADRPAGPPGPDAPWRRAAEPGEPEPGGAGPGEPRTGDDQDGGDR